MNYKSFNLGDWIDHISGVIEDEGELDGNEMRDLVEFLSGLSNWIPIKTRPLTEEEKEEIGHEYAFMYDCSLPDDGQNVLITDCYGNVEVDTFCRDYEGFYFETNCDDGEVIAWQPLPQPYKAESEEEK